MAAYKNVSQVGDPDYFVGVDVSSINIFKNREPMLEGIDYTIDSIGLVSYAESWAGETCEIVETRSNDITSKLEDILTATMGSWSWDKRENILQVFDTAGNPQFKYEVSDTAESAKKERRQDLE